MESEEMFIAFSMLTLNSFVWDDFEKLTYIHRTKLFAIFLNTLKILQRPAQKGTSW